MYNSVGSYFSDQPVTRIVSWQRYVNAVDHLLMLSANWLMRSTAAYVNFTSWKLS